MQLPSAVSHTPGWVVILALLALLLCALLMPAMVMAAVAGCVAIVRLVSIARRALALLQAPERFVPERAQAFVTVMCTGPPVLTPLRT